MNRRRALRYGLGAIGTLGAAGMIDARPEHALAHQGDQAGSVDWNAVARAAGGPGQMKEDGVFLVELSRSDIKATAFGVPVQADLAADGEAAFKQMGNTTMVMGELALLQKEVAPVMRGLIANGFSVSAVHNHLFEISPLIMFIHFGGMGDAMQLARKLRAALAGSKTPVETSATKKAPAINIEGIQKLLGMAGEVGDEVFYVEVPRNEQITMGGMVIPSAMGVESYLYFQSAGGGKAASQGELALLAGEVNPVARTLEQHGFTVTAIHNHMTTVHPMLFWMHVWGTGNPTTLAQGLRAALAHTNSRM